ncbi:MAG: sigma-70 family RNA polymerase sigma factor [Thiotrichaceae bacterium]
MPSKSIQRRSTSHITSSTPDEVLLDLIATSNQKAFSVLYKRYSPILQRFCTRMLNGDVALAADIVDEALFEVWGSAAKFAGKSKPSTWIHSIARYKLIDYLRKNSDSRIDKDLLRASLDDCSPSEETLLSDQQQDAIVVRHMDKLSEDHREALLLSYFKELSIKEMAAALDISENTVKTRLFYARQRFKKILSKMGVHKDRFNGYE